MKPIENARIQIKTLLKISGGAILVVVLFEANPLAAA